jgi:hypothetical protein
VAEAIIPTFKWDLIQGSEGELTPETTRVKRIGLAKGIDMTVPHLALIDLVNAAGFPGMRSVLDETKPWLILLRVHLVGMSEHKGWVRVECEYGTEQSEFLPTVYTLTDDSYLVQTTSALVPGTRTPIRATYTDSSNSANTFSDLVMMKFDRQARAIGVTALRYTRPSGGWQDRVGYVNNGDWPANFVTTPSGLGIPGAEIGQTTGRVTILQRAATTYSTGFWKLTRYRTTWNQQGYTIVEAQAATKVFEDWSEYGVLQNRQTGRYPFGGLDAGEAQGIIDSLKGPAYTHGIIASGNGIVRVGPAPTTDFFSIFGF